MKKNVGQIDKSVRLLLGVTITILGYLNNSWWGVIGIVPILTALIGWCPLYVPMGISTIFKTNKS